MQCRHLELMELEQSFRVLFELDPTNVDAVPGTTVDAVRGTTVELTIEQPHVPPQDPVKLQLPATVEPELASPMLIQHSENLLTEVSPAQSESELMDQEEACVVDDIGAHYGLPVLRVLATDRPPPEPGEELIDEEEACAVDDDGETYAFPVLRVLPTDRPPPQPGQELIDEEEACAVNATGADDVLLVLRVFAGITETTIEAFSTPIQHGYTVEKPLRGYALPAPQQTVSCRPPPKPGDVSRDTRASGSTTATRRTIRLKASRRDRLGRVTARNGTEREGGRRTVKGDGSERMSARRGHRA
ncbi:hypothetical protein FN846DRAFT_886002 [Sphaerosporella brunnea]|uniref:Uncharacterized protein n=1 Tax=Sphaerosporella brunnea TaxID=1250544 RepID=A0A5J5FAR0_9PEZI|nr:hypothetical protein FN846DRAFT_886002 [Sphaerosporella brunnea]